MEPKHNIRALLSHRELQCFYHILLGRAGRQIAELLQLSVRTVEVYFDNIKKKLGVRTFSEVVLFAHDNGYMSIAEELWDTDTQTG
ncbi:MAG: hypothetical protein COB66_01000 [Coxiella sp. (in: Bacteria)]|nr:MAG: hypothetical protein COB66_01000 [Coxiella sp. (in: g-proteobacteria)]